MLSSVNHIRGDAPRTRAFAPWEDGTTETANAADAKPYTGAVHPGFGAFSYMAGTTYECQVERDTEDGLLYAGKTPHSPALVFPHYAWALFLDSLRTS